MAVGHTHSLRRSAEVVAAHRRVEGVVEHRQEQRTSRRMVAARRPMEAEVERRQEQRKSRRLVVVRIPEAVEYKRGQRMSPLLMAGHGHNHSRRPEETEGTRVLQMTTRQVVMARRQCLRMVRMEAPTSNLVKSALLQNLRLDCLMRVQKEAPRLRLVK